MAKVIDAVAVGLAGFSGKLYFFKGDRYLRVERSTGVVEANQPISAGWVLPSPFDHGIDAACNGHGEHEGKAFFFKGSQFLRYDWDGDKVDWAPQAISWWGVPAAFAAGIECALEGGPGYEGWVYFFKGDKYVRYSWSG